VDKRAHFVWLAAAIALLAAGPLGLWDTAARDVRVAKGWLNSPPPKDPARAGWHHPQFPPR
jgi:hypothetical protein